MKNLVAVLMLVGLVGCSKPEAKKDECWTDGKGATKTCLPKPSSVDLNSDVTAGVTEIIPVGGSQSGSDTGMATMTAHSLLIVEGIADPGYHHLMHTLWARPGQQTCEHLMENGETCYVMKPQNTTVCARGRDSASEKAASWIDKHVQSAHADSSVTIVAPVNVTSYKCADGAGNEVPCDRAQFLDFPKESK